MITFVNNGNTCYANSAMQLLINSRHLNDFITSQQTRLCRQIHNYEPRINNQAKILDFVRSNHQQFRALQQQDAHEYLLCLLEELEKESQQSFIFDTSHIQSTHLENVSSDTKSFSSEGSPAPLGFMNFSYQIQYTCTNCSNVAQFEYSESNVLLNYNNELSIDQMIENNLKANCNGEYQCEICGAPSSVQIQITKYPQQLILVLNRFSHEKLQFAVRIPAVMELRDSRYKLNSLVYHSGTLNSGHYTAGIFKTGRFYEVSDSCYYETAYKDLDPRVYIVSYELVGQEAAEKFEFQRPRQHVACDPRAPRVPGDNLLISLSCRKSQEVQAVSRQQIQLVINQRVIELPELSFLPSIKKLILTNCRFAEMKVERLPPHLNYLCVAHCNLRHFPDISELIESEIIEFIDCRLLEIRDNCIPKQVALLNLSRNRLVTIPNLQECLCLRRIILDGNKGLRANFQYNLPWCLREISLRDCRLAYLGGMQQLLCLEVINLRGNQLRREEVDALMQCYALEIDRIPEQ